MSKAVFMALVKNKTYIAQGVNVSKMRQFTELNQDFCNMFSS